MAIAAGGTHSVALKSNGTVVAWGAGGGAKSTYPHKGQTKVPTGLKGVKAIAAGDAFVMALKNDGTVIAWGDDSRGQTKVPPNLKRLL